MVAHSLDTISLCTGGGGLDLALELAIPSARAVCMVEREAFAVAQLVSAMEAGHLPAAPIWSDVRTFDGKPWRGLVDGLIGGIPCQPHSLAGRKQGQHDGRDLWSDARRIVATARPWFVLIENVAGMLSAGADEVAGAERVWRDLRKLGYSVESGLFAAREVGASHERQRLFILGVADREGDLWRPQFQARGTRGGRAGPAGSGDSLQGVGLADPFGTGLQGGELSRPYRERDGEEAHGSASEFRRAHVVDAEGARGRPIHERQRRPGEGAGEFDRPSLFPPGPADLSSWRDVLDRTPELEPAFRRVADGLASRLDIARVDRLRLLGNGVVPLEGGYAIRTLIARLAQRAAPGADELVRLMGA